MIGYNSIFRVFFISLDASKRYQLHFLQYSHLEKAILH